MMMMSVVKISGDTGADTITIRVHRLLSQSYLRHPTAATKIIVLRPDRRSETVAVADFASVGLAVLVALAVAVVARPYSVYGTVALGVGGVFVGVDRYVNSFGYSGGKIGSFIWRIKKHVCCSCCCLLPTL